MTPSERGLSRLEIARGLRWANWDAVFFTLFVALTSGAFQIGLARYFGANDLWIGIITSVPSLAGALQILTAYLADTAPSQKRLVIRYAFYSRLPFIAIAFLPFVSDSAPRLQLFAGLLILSAILGSFAGPAFLAWLSALVPPDYRGRYFGRRNMILGLVSAASALPPAIFLDQAVKYQRFSEAVAFGVLYGLGALFLFLSLWALRKMPEPPRTPVERKGIARLGRIPNYKTPPPDTPVQISVLNPRDEVIYETRTRLNRMGAFHGSFSTSPEAETGYYRIVARVGAYGEIQQSVPISAYRKPTYRITVKPDRELYLPNETVRVQINTDYYFGMPVPNTQLMYTLYRREKWSWDYYSEGENDYLDWSEEYGDYEGSVYGEIVATGELTTDAAGRATLSLRPSDLLPRGDGNRPRYWDEADITYDYTLEVYALSEGWEGAKGQTRFEIAPSVWQATLRPETEFGEKGRVYRYTVRLTDRRTGQPVQAALRWQAGKQLFAGERVRTEILAEGTVQTNAQGVAEIQFTPEVSGDWEVRLTARDADGNAFTTRHILWIWDDDYQPWWWGRSRDANALEARLNKREFAPGESAELALRTPHRDAVFYITLEGDRLYQSQVVKAQGALTRVRIPISREQIPNAYISVCMVRNKELVQRVLEVKVGERVGMLQVSLQTDKPRYEPGETLTARIQTTDAQGRPTPAELSLAVVDEAIYSIFEDHPASVRAAFYGRRWNAVRTDFSAVWLALQGDKGSVETVRRDFPDTAFWQPTITTDARGQAMVRLTIISPSVD